MFIQRAARVLALAMLAGTLLTACGEFADRTIASQVGTTAENMPSVTAVQTTAQTTVPAIPTTAAVTTTAMIPETAPTPQATDLPQTTEPAPQTTDLPATSAATSAEAEPVTSEPAITTTKSVNTTTVTPETTVPTATSTPATVTIPVTSAPVTEPIPPATDGDRSVLLYEDVKAMWISQYDMNLIYTEDGAQREQASYTALVRSLLDNVQSLGFNTVFLQVRPNADSMYPSAYYPMSKYVVGAYGIEAAYDPVAILIEEAHARELSIHAWINPLRCMRDTEIASVDRQYKIRQWYDDETLCGKYIVLYNGTYYLNPAYEEVRELIADGAAELLERYAFDGLHMDDYFYPTTVPSFDAEAYAEYLREGGAAELADFRRSRIDLLVKLLYETVKAECGELLYGISPACNLDTVYNIQYADVYNWCANEGYIDYICPQVYTGFWHDTLDFVSVCTAFSELIKTDSVKLIVGMTFGKALDGYDNWAGSGKYEWRDCKDVLQRSLEYTKTLEHCVGISVFCYQYFYDPVTGIAVTETAEEVANFSPVLQAISWKKETD